MNIPAIPGFHPQAFRKYFKNTGFLVIGKVGSLIIKMLIGFAVANYLGKGQNGVLNYTNSFVVIFLAIATLGLDQFIVRDLVNQPKNRKLILGTSFILKLLGALLIIPIVALIYPFYNNEETPLNYIIIVSFIGVFQAFNLIESFYQSQVQAKNIMIVNVTANIISAGIKLLFIYLQLPLIWFVCALVFDAAILAVGYISIYVFQKHNLFHWEFSRSFGTQLLKKSWPLMFSAVLVTVYMKIDQLMIGRMLDEGQLGVYSTAVQLSEAWYFIPMAVVSSVFPAIITAKNQDEKRYLKRMQNLYDLMLLLSVTVALIMTFSADLLYRLAYKEEFAEGASVLVIHVWASVFVFLGVASGQYLINEGFTKLSLIRTAVGALVNIILNLIWIPTMGIKGAALATLLAYASAPFVLLLIPKTRRQGIMMLKSVFLISIIKSISSILSKQNKVV